MKVIEEASTIPQENFKYTEEVKLLDHILKQSPNTECFSFLVREKNTHEEAFYHRLHASIQGDNIDQATIETIEVQIQYIISIL